MTWTKLDDGFWSNPTIDQIGNEAAGAFVRMLSYCGQHHTDGRVSPGAASYITRPRVLALLVGSGLIEENGKGWVIPDYLDFNPSAEEAKAKQKVRQEAGRRGGLASAKRRSK